MKNLHKILTIIILILSLTACGKTASLEISGGELVKCSTICSDTYEFPYELPLITNTKIKDLSDISISYFDIEGEGEYEAEYIETTEGSEYNGKYYYYVHITVSVDPEQPADFTIKSVSLNIDGTILDYEISDLHFSNIKSEFGEDYSTDTADILTYDENPIVMYEHLPQDDNVHLSFEILKDCTIHNIGYKDFVEMKDVCAYVNDSPVDSTNDMKASAGDIVSYEFDAQYKDNADAADWLKTSFYLTCTDDDDQNYAFCDSQGLIVLDADNDQFIKNYIDKNKE